jgi:hypothetical protein
MWRVHRLDRIWAKKPAKLLNSKSLTLDFSRQQIWPVFLPDSRNFVLSSDRIVADLENTTDASRIPVCHGVCL